MSLMRKITLTPYSVGQDQYDVKGSIVAVLFAHKLNPMDLIEYDRIAKKIEASETEIELNEGEYQIIRSCVESLSVGYERRDLEFVQRVLNAGEITSEEIIP